MAAPFYGNPESVRLIVKNLPKLQGPKFIEVIELYDDLIRPLLDADLHGMFSDWDEPDSTNRNVISTLWTYRIAHEIMGSEFATNNMGVQSAYSGDLMTKFEELMQAIKAGRINVLGATRHSAAPTGRAQTRKRLSLGDGPDQPKEVDSLFPHGLRR